MFWIIATATILAVSAPSAPEAELLPVRDYPAGQIPVTVVQLDGTTETSMVPIHYQQRVSVETATEAVVRCWGSEIPDECPEIKRVRSGKGIKIGQSGPRGDSQFVLCLRTGKTPDQCR